MYLPLVRVICGAFAAAVLLAPVALAAPTTSYADSYSWTAAVDANDSYNWAGYVSADRNSTYTEVSASWTVPAVTDAEGSALSADAAWVGIGGVASQDLIQAGTQAIVDVQGDTSYEAWYEVLPSASQAIPLKISPGDKVDVSLKQVVVGQWEVTVNNETTGAHYSTQVAYDSSLSSAEWIQEMPSSARGLSLIPLDDFNAIAFSLASTVENGSNETLSQADAQPLAMVDVQGETLAEPSALSQEGDSFAVMRLASLRPRF